MPFVFIVVGIGLVVVAVRGTQATAFSLLQSEFSGPNSFIKWALAIFILGAIGYIPTVRPVTRALLALVLLVIFLKNGKGLFAQFNAQIANPVSPAQAAAPQGNVTIDPLQATDPNTGSPLQQVGQLGQMGSGALTLGQGISGGSGANNNTLSFLQSNGFGGGGGVQGSADAGFIAA